MLMEGVQRWRLAKSTMHSQFPLLLTMKILLTAAPNENTANSWEECAQYDTTLMEIKLVVVVVLNVC